MISRDRVLAEAQGGYRGVFCTCVRLLHHRDVQELRLHTCKVKGAGIFPPCQFVIGRIRLAISSFGDPHSLGLRVVAAHDV